MLFPVQYSLNSAKSWPKTPIIPFFLYIKMPCHRVISTAIYDRNVKLCAGYYFPGCFSMDWVVGMGNTVDSKPCVMCNMYVTAVCCSHLLLFRVIKRLCWKLKLTDNLTGFNFMDRRYFQLELRHPQYSGSTLLVNRFGDRSYTRGMIRNKIHVISPGCPRPNIA